MQNNIEARGNLCTELGPPVVYPILLTVDGISDLLSRGLWKRHQKFMGAFHCVGPTGLTQWKVFIEQWNLSRENIDQNEIFNRTETFQLHFKQYSIYSL